MASGTTACAGMFANICADVCSDMGVDRRVDMHAYMGAGTAAETCRHGKFCRIPSRMEPGSIESVLTFVWSCVQPCITTCG